MSLESDYPQCVLFSDNLQEKTLFSFFKKNFVFFFQKPVKSSLDCSLTPRRVAVGWNMVDPLEAKPYNKQKIDPYSPRSFQLLISWAMGRTFWHNPLHAGISSGLSFCRPVDSVTTCATAPSCPENTFPLQSSTISYGLSTLSSTVIPDSWSVIYRWTP